VPRPSGDPDGPGAASLTLTTIPLEEIISRLTPWARPELPPHRARTGARRAERRPSDVGARPVKECRGSERLRGG